jgi:ribosomal protein S18 acetylase RimI-like enzyme
VAMTKTADVTYRWLEPDELPKVDPIIKQHMWMPLSEVASRVRAVEREGKIIGFCVLQFVPYCGPMYIEPEYRGAGIAERLADEMKGFMEESEARGWIATAESAHARKLLEDRGMHLLTLPIYVTQLPGEIVP